jgi:hypothetical protein
MTGIHPQNRRLGYARVSTYGQTLDAQLEQLRGAGCTKIYREKVTGARSDRRELLKLPHALAPGDVVTVTRIDRLARSTFDLFRHREADRGRQGAIPLTRRAVGRHRHRAADDCRVGRIGGRGARSYQHPHRRGPQPGAKARATHGPTVETHDRAEGRGPPTTGGGLDARGTRAQLRRGQEHDFAGDDIGPWV